MKKAYIVPEVDFVEYEKDVMDAFGGSNSISLADYNWDIENKPKENTVPNGVQSSAEYFGYVQPTFLGDGNGESDIE